MDQSDNTVIGLQETGAQRQNSEPTRQSWEDGPDNPMNWSSVQKFKVIFIISASAFTASIGTSLPSSAAPVFQKEFGVTTIQSILPVSLYVLALGLGPVVGGPLSETVGRHPIYAGSMLLGGLFTIGAAVCQNFASLCILRFFAGFCFSPSLAVGAGSISDLFPPAQRGLPSTVFILMPFLGPGFGPVIGSFVVVRKGWRWTQWTLALFAAVSFLAGLLGRETYRPVLERRHNTKTGLVEDNRPPLMQQLGLFFKIALFRPIHMLLTEPIITFICLYVSCEFATLFTFFSGVPFVFRTVYGFETEQTGLIFISIIIGCLLGAATVIILTVLFYFPQIKRHHPDPVPPEHRLYPAMFGSVGLPIGLFMFAWTARHSISWAVPAFAIIPFAWGNLCIFVSTMQYIVDTYRGHNVASGASANSLARYVFAAIIPLFTIQMYRALGVAWAGSLLGFVALALAPVPWVLFRWGKSIRARSRYETV